VFDPGAAIGGWRQYQQPPTKVLLLKGVRVPDQIQYCDVKNFNMPALMNFYDKAFSKKTIFGSDSDPDTISLSIRVRIEK
jgi:hypothetical protein